MALTLRPLSPTRWNYAAAAHLLNRAGFGGSPAEIDKLVQLGHAKAVDSLVNYEIIPDETAPPDWTKTDTNRFAQMQEMRTAPQDKKMEMRRMEQREQRENISDLRYRWIQRMAFGPRPLQEKLTLFWHGHFATSGQKVKNATAMWQQNEIFRRYGSGNWLVLLTAVSKDPAMMFWLDQAQSRKQHPNENFAREVMELFTLGEGHYTEKDISEAARAYTGWSIEPVTLKYIWRPNMHDYSPKTIFGRTGNFTGDDVLKMIVAQPQAARFITKKLWTFFGAENPPDQLVDSLATVFRTGGNFFKPVLRAMFTCEDFYSPAVMRQQVKSPVQWLISTVRTLERELPPAQYCSNILRQLGQDLLMPPNVKGWDGGLSWITTNNLLLRYNSAAYLVLGENPMNGGGRGGGNRGNRPGRLPPGVRVDVAKLFQEDVRKDKKLLAAAVQKRMIQAEMKAEHESALRAYLDSQGELNDVDVLHALRLVMCTPEFQLT